MMITDPCAHLVSFFEQLTPDSLAQIDQHYTADAYFKDPFNEVHDITAVRAIFAHMFTALEAPRFTVTERIVQGSQCFLVWDFQFRMRRVRPTETQTVRGGSHLRFAADGRVSYHRDYWDAAEELYEKLPVLGSLMRWLKRQANT